MDVAAGAVTGLLQEMVEAVSSMSGNIERNMKCDSGMSEIDSNLETETECLDISSDGDSDREEVETDDLHNHYSVVVSATDAVKALAPLIPAIQPKVCVVDCAPTAASMQDRAANPRFWAEEENDEDTFIPRVASVSSLATATAAPAPGPGPASGVRHSARVAANQGLMASSASAKQGVVGVKIEPPDPFEESFQINGVAENHCGSTSLPGNFTRTIPRAPTRPQQSVRGILGPAAASPPSLSASWGEPQQNVARAARFSPFRCRPPLNQQLRSPFLNQNGGIPISTHSGGGGLFSLVTAARDPQHQQHQSHSSSNNNGQFVTHVRNRVPSGSALARDGVRIRPPPFLNGLPPPNLNINNGFPNSAPPPPPQFSSGNLRPGAAPPSLAAHSPAVSVLGKFMNLNSLPSVPYRFTPPPPELTSSLNLPRHGYGCRDCGDTFALKSSLEFHLQRRSVLIQGNCLVCRKAYTFYNRCAYFYHIRKHMEKPVAGVEPNKRLIQILGIHPISSADLDRWFNDTAFQRCLDIEKLLDYEKEAAAELMSTTSSYRNQPSVGNDAEASAVTGQQTTPVLTSQLRTALQGGTGTPANTDPPLRQQRTARSPPQPIPSSAPFISHVRRKVTAPVADIPAPPPTTSLSVVNPPSRVDTALVSQPISQPQPQQQVTPISGLKCPECPMLSTSKDALRDHFAYNLSLQQKQFICHVCQAVYFSQCSYQAHARVHRHVPPHVCAECGQTLGTSRGLQAHFLDHRLGPTVLDAWRCAKCFTFYSSRDALIMHVSNVHCESYYKCGGCPMAFKSQQNLADHRAAAEHPVAAHFDVKSISKCLECDTVFQVRDQLLSHLRTHYDAMQPFRVYRCPICGRLMENKNGLLTHYKINHKIFVDISQVIEVKIKLPDAEPERPPPSGVVQTPDGKRDVPAGPGGFHPPHPETTSGSPSCVSGHSAISSHAPQSTNNTGLPPQSLLDGPTPPKRGKLTVQPTPTPETETTFTCARCSFVSTARRTFISHIKDHAENKNASDHDLLCLTCGLCFGSETSLSCHLIAVHKAANVPSAIAESLFERSNAKGTFQCDECLKFCPTQDELTKHVKSHGLKFIASHAALLRK